MSPRAKLVDSPRTDAYNALSADIFGARKLIEKLSRDMPRNADVVALRLVFDKAIADLAVLRTTINRHRPIKRRDTVNGPVKLRKNKKRDWAKLQRAYRAKKAAEAAARLRLDHNDFPALVVR